MPCKADEFGVAPNCTKDPTAKQTGPSDEDPLSCPKKSVDSQPTTGNPIVLGTGNKYLVETDVAGLGVSTLKVVRTYNSAPSNRAAYDLAAQWSIGLKRGLGLDNATTPTVVIAVRPDGKALRFTASGGAWAGDADINDRLSQIKSGATTTGWRYQAAADLSTEEYDANGILLRITDANGLSQRYSVSNGSGGILYGTTAHASGYLAPTCVRPAGFGAPGTAGTLLCVSDEQGRQINLGYDASGRLDRVADPLGRITQYGFDASNNLVRVTWPDGTIRTYHYEDTAHPHALTGITDENGARHIRYSYDASGRAIGEVLAGGVGSNSLSFGSNATTLTDALGTARSYRFQTILGVQKSTGADQPAGSGCAAAASSLSYDGNGNIASRTDFNGNVTTYSYDLARNLETRRVEASGSADARTLSTQWHATWRLPVKVAGPLKLTTFVYNGDSDGGQTVTCAPTDAIVPNPNGAGTIPAAVLCRKIEQATQDADGSQGFSASPTGSARSWAWSYDRYGRVLASDGPRTDVTDVTTFAYYPDSDPDLGKRGNLASISNALGQVTRITAYDANGRPLSITDANGTVTTLGYDLRGRLTGKDVGGELTSYRYDSVGQLTRITLPDGASLSYAYDAAHRLTGISDGLGNRIDYTLDAMGNRTREDVKDPNQQLSRTKGRAFDALNRLYQDIGAQNQITQYAYDANGNLTSITDPLNQTTGRAYDALNRLIRLTDPGNGQTRLAYNGQDRLIQVTDPRNLVTGYSLDGLGNQTQQSSPDTGISTQTLDAAGNVLTRTDARGQSTTTQYDALNRPTLIRYSDGRQEQLGWDQGANGAGRLTRIDESANGSLIASTEYAYDAQGRVVSETRSIAGQRYVTAYRYQQGRLTGLTYPSGKQVDYQRDSQGRIVSLSVTDNGQSRLVLNQVQYHPFGGVKSYVTGAGQTVSRLQDTDGRTSAYSLGSGLWQLGYDAASRIGYQTDSGNAANTVSYGYDSLDRLTNAILPAATLGYGYDASGNRTRQSIGGSTYTHQVSPTSNRLTGVSTAPPRSYSYDAAGNRTGDGQLQHVYDARGRMVEAQSGAQATQYVIDALGQRIRKTNSTEDTVFHYDRDGHLISETSAAGQARRDYLWLGDLPVGVLQ